MSWKGLLSMLLCGSAPAFAGDLSAPTDGEVTQLLGAIAKTVRHCRPQEPASPRCELARAFMIGVAPRLQALPGVLLTDPGKDGGVLVLAWKKAKDGTPRAWVVELNPDTDEDKADIAAYAASVVAGKPKTTSVAHREIMKFLGAASAGSEVASVRRTLALTDTSDAHDAICLRQSGGQLVAYRLNKSSGGYAVTVFPLPGARQAPAACSVPELDAVCRSGDSGACIDLGDALIVRAECQSAALPYYEHACQAGAPRGCTMVANARFKNARTKEDLTNAVKLFEPPCEAGEPAACANLGSAYWDGKGVERDPKRSAALYDRACTGGDPFACTMLGSQHRQGDGVLQDREKARSLFDRACSGESASGCALLGEAFFQGLGGKKDRQRAVELWTSSCEDGAALGCYDLAQEVRPRDPVQARGLFEKACQFGLERACAEAKPP